MIPTPHDPDGVERELTSALHDRAAGVEPSPDAYAVLAAKVDAATAERRRWWTSPRLTWALGATAALVVAAGAIYATTRGGSDTDDTASGLATPTAEAAGEPAVEPTPDGAVGPPATFADGVIWPLGDPDASWPATPEDAAQRLYAEVLGIGEVPIAVVAESYPVQVTVAGRGEDGEPFGTAAIVTVIEVDGVWGVVGVGSPHVSITSPQADEPVTLEDLTVRGEGFAFEGLIELRVVDRAGATVASGFGTAGGVEPAPYNGVFTDVDRNFVGPALLIASTGSVLDTDVPGVAAVRLVVGPGSSIDGAEDELQPLALRSSIPLWPTADWTLWPSTPEEAAQEFTIATVGDELPLSEVDRGNSYRTFQLLRTGEDGLVGDAAAATVHVVGGLDDNGDPRWAVQSVTSDEIQIDRVDVSPDGLEVTPVGFGRAFEGTIDAAVVTGDGAVIAGWVRDGGWHRAVAAFGIDLFGRAAQRPSPLGADRCRGPWRRARLACGRDGVAHRRTAVLGCWVGPAGSRSVVTRCRRIDQNGDRRRGDRMRLGHPVRPCCAAVHGQLWGRDTRGRVAGGRGPGRGSVAVPRGDTPPPIR